LSFLISNYTLSI